MTCCRSACDAVNVLQMRTSRHFCLDVVLICILLGLAFYLVELFKKK